jgi:hypothetical protein
MKNTLIETLPDGALVHVLDRRGRKQTRLRLGPNHVHAFIRHKDGSITDLGISTNLLTNTGRDLWAATFGHAANITGTATATTTTSMTGTGFTAAANVGWRVFMPITSITTPPVYGNIGANTTTVLTIDQWWTAADGVGTTPGNNAFYILPCCAPRFMGLTADTAAASAGDTVLASEQTANGLGRAKATYAHTGATATYSQQVVFTVTGGPVTVHKMGLFTAATLTAAGIMVFETVLNTDATVNNGDTLTVTDTITLSG